MNTFHICESSRADWVLYFSHFPIKLVKKISLKVLAAFSMFLYINTHWVTKNFQKNSLNTHLWTLRGNNVCMSFMYESDHSSRESTHCFSSPYQTPLLCWLAWGQWPSTILSCPKAMQYSALVHFPLILHSSTHPASVPSHRCSVALLLLDNAHFFIDALQWHFDVIKSFL